MKSGGMICAYGVDGVTFSNDLTAWQDGKNAMAYPCANLKNTYRTGVTPTFEYNATSKAICSIQGTLIARSGSTVAVSISGHYGAKLELEAGANFSANITEDYTVYVSSTGTKAAYFTSTIVSGGQINGVWTAFAQGTTYEFNGANWVA